MPRDNILTRICGILYAADTPTNVTPSIHVYNSIAVMIAAVRTDAKLFRSWFSKAVMAAIGLSIILATMFLKQHSFSDVVIATGAIRMEGTSREYLPIEYPAVADFGLVRALAQSAEELGYRYHTGVVQSKDSFYGQHSPTSMPNGEELLRKWNAWIAAGCLASEMEATAIYATAAARGVRAATVLHVIWNQMRRDKFGDKEESHDVDRAIQVALAALRCVIRNASDGKADN